jgi:hypothetical protein
MVNLEHIIFIRQQLLRRCHTITVSVPKEDVNLYPSERNERHQSRSNSMHKKRLRKKHMNMIESDKALQGKLKRSSHL